MNQNDWNYSQNAWLYLTIGLLFILGSSLIIHMVFFAEEFSWVAKYTKDTLFVSAVSQTTFLFKSNVNSISTFIDQIIGYCCALEAFILAILAFYPTCRRRFRRVLTDDDQMGLRDDDRELSPLSSNDIGDKLYRDNEIPNHHFHKSMKRSVTDTIRDNLDCEPDLPIMVQKPAYIPSEFKLSFILCLLTILWCSKTSWSGLQSKTQARIET